MIIDKKVQWNIENTVIITIKHLQENENLALNNPWNNPYQHTPLNK